jgi:diacylglycerol kinase family enzyme
MAESGAPLRQTMQREYGSDKDAVARLPATMPHPNVLLAVVNPLSGERAASQAVEAAFLAILGPHRVFRLDLDTFRSPTGLADHLRRRAAEHEAMWREQSSAASNGTTAAEPLQPAGLRRRPTVLVAGGDGTVAFVMNVVQDACYPSPLHPDTASDEIVLSPRARAADERVALPSGADASTLLSGSAGASVSNASAVDAADSVPAVAVFPMGTGNDLSHTLGFGLGFTRNHFCMACSCCPQDIDRLLADAVDAPIVRFDRWEATISHVVPRAQEEAGDGEAAVLLRVGFNNYVSFGMDADVSRRFDESRKAYPSLHHMRTMNKVWYGVHGLAAAPFAPTFRNDNVAISIDKLSTPLTSAAKNCKAVVITNVTGYSGGVNLWNLARPTTVKLPRPGKDGRGYVDANVTLMPASIGDGALEVQTLGGLVHMTLLRTGVFGADRIGQGSTVEIVVSCPDGKPMPVRLQADGEPLGAFAAPFKLRVGPAPRGGLFVHAARASAAALHTSTAVTY